MNRQEYETRKAAHQTRQNHKKEKQERAAQEAEMAKTPFWNHPDRIVRYTGWLQLYTFALFGATALLFGAAVITAYILHGTDEKIGTQANAIERQLKVMEADQRPWIKSMFDLISFRFTDTMDAEITYFGTFRNIGKSPAQNIRSRIVGAVITEQTVFNSVDEERSQCELAARDGVTAASPGIFLFPGEDAPPDILGGRGGGHAYVTASEYAKAWPNADNVEFKLIGCFDYRLSEGQIQHGQTGFSYFITVKAGDHRSGFKPAKGRNVSRDQISFSIEPFSGGWVK
jgi:hypothetical protein